MPNATVLVVDDEPLIRWSLVNRLKDEGYRTLEAGTAADALAQHRDGADLVLLDFALPDANGLTVLKQIKEADPDTLVIMLTANTEVGTAVEAMKDGAFHYANKPFDLDEIVLLVEKALETTDLQARGPRAAGAQRAALRAEQHRGRQHRHQDGTSAAGEDRRQPRVHGAADRRERHRQGPRREGDSLQQQPRAEAVHEHHLLGAARDAARKRAVRPRARRLHRRRSPEARA